MVQELSEMGREAMKNGDILLFPTQEPSPKISLSYTNHGALLNKHKTPKSIVSLVLGYD
jgi:hypothetical protein